MHSTFVLTLFIICSLEFTLFSLWHQLFTSVKCSSALPKMNRYSVRENEMIFGNTDAADELLLNC